MTYQPQRMPRREDIGADEILVRITSPAPDAEGRVDFNAYWVDPGRTGEDGPPSAVRSQTIHGDLAAYTARQARRGKTVKEWTP